MALDKYKPVLQALQIRKEALGKRRASPGERIMSSLFP